jgi:hypothetical protein
LALQQFGVISIDFSMDILLEKINGVRGAEIAGRNYLTTSVDNDVLSLKIAVTVSRELGSESRPLSAAYR